MLEENEDFGQLAKVRANLGVAYLQQKQYERGIAVLQRAAEDAEAFHDKTTAANAALNLGQGLLQLNRYDEALKEFYVASAHYHDANNVAGESDALLGVGTVALAQSRTD